MTATQAILSLIQGEEVPYENGLPAYVRLSKRRVRKVLDPYVFD